MRIELVRFKPAHSLGALLKKVSILLLAVLAALEASAQSTAFTYQGRLNDGANPANGSYDLTFSLFDADSTGNQVGSVLTNAATAVSNGLFTVKLDFGAGVFTGADRWLEIGVATNGGGAFSTLTPRQQVRSAPYAIQAASAAIAASASSVSAANILGAIPLAQLPEAVVTNGASGVSLTGAFSGNGAGLIGVDLRTVNALGAIAWSTRGSGRFALASSPGVGTQPSSVVAADVNGDGKMDLICANFGDNTLSVLTNDGSGGLVLSSSPSVGAEPVLVTAADVNGDGKVDLICANLGDNTLSVLTNNGSGRFVLASSPSVGDIPVSVTAADVNGDGWVDLICANAVDNALSVLTNNGSGSFVLSSSPSVGVEPVSVTATDINGDGKVDLISANQGANTLSVLTNNGNGGFVLASAPGVGSFPYSVMAADVNGDGKVDLISANNGDNTLSVLTNDGSGGFGLASSPSVGAQPASVTAADVNGDGRTDLICANSADNSLTVLTNNGSGGFGLASTSAVGTAPLSVVAADVNGDGTVDLISANAGDNTLSVLTNALIVFARFNGDGDALANLNASKITSGAVADERLSANVPLLNVTQTFTGLNAFNNAAGNFTGIFSGDGAGLTGVDLRTVNSLGAIAWTTNSVGFALASALAVDGGPRWVVAADINGDGKLDLVSANVNANTLSVLTNDGSGGFVLASSPGVGNTPLSVAAADVNGDGKVDLISANVNDSTLTVLTNDGSGGFVLASSLSVGANPSAVVAADVNGDGKVDLISANNGDNTLSVLTNDGNGGFVLASSPGVGSFPSSVATGDVNGDGKVDLICSHPNDSTLSVLTNDGSGGFVLASSPVVGNLPYSVTAADVNGDGKVDLISANFGDNTLSVLTNNGSGSFGLASSRGVGEGPISVVAADINGDGKVDLISADAKSITLSVLTNNGIGGFGLATSPGVGSTPFLVVAADINGDGKVDLVSASPAEGTLSVLTNISFTSHTANFTGNGAGLTNLNAATITGTLSVAQIPGLDASKITTGTLGAAQIPGLDASKITTGTLSVAQIPSLDASKITTGMLDAAQIPSLDASKITTGTLSVAQIPNLDAAKITTGTVADARFSANVALLNRSSQTFSGGTNIFSGNVQANSIRARGGPPGAFGNNNNGYAFIGNGGDIDSGMFSSADGQVEFYGNAIERMRITSTGKVGIGTTNPATALQVNGIVTGTSFTGDGSGLTSLTAGNLTGAVADARLSDNVALLDANQTFTGGTNIFGGSVHANAFHARGGPPGALGANNNGYAFIGNGGDTDSGMFSSAEGQVEFYGNATEHMRITSSGNVGIGTTNPATALHVNGTVTAASFTGDGSGLTSVNAANLTGSIPSAALTSVPAGNLSGTVADARLSTNVARLNNANVFTGTNRFSGEVTVTNLNNQFAGTFTGTLFASAPYLKFAEVTLNVPAGSAVAGTNNWRAFNVELTDTHNLGSTNGAGGIILPAGTYQCHISVPAFRVETHQSRLRTSAGTNLLFGTIGYSDSSTGGSEDRSQIDGQFTLAATTTLRVQHWCTLANAGDGLGTLQSFNWGDANQTIFAVAEFWKIK